MKVDGAKLLEEFRRYLSDHNLPATHQRLAVADVVFSAADHLSADDVARRVAKRGEPVGTATIYRTLDLLVKSGLAKEHDFGEGFRRYEPMAAGHHEHCICSGCGRVMEFSNDRLERMIALLAEEVEFRPHHHRLEVYGLCRSCQQSNPFTRTR